MEGEVQRLKTPPPVVSQPVPEGERTYGPGNYPQTQDEWDLLFLEKPTFATDLRNQFNYQQQAYVQDFRKNRDNAVKTLTQDHPDLYVFELDETGQPKKNSEGKPLLKYNADGSPIFNKDSEKGRLWIDIFNEDPDGWQNNKNAPRLMMLEMESRLRAKGANMIKGQNNSQAPDDSGLAPQGVTPPKSGPVKFASVEEEQHARRAVARGTFASLEEWAKDRDETKNGYAEPNRRPDFSQR